MEYIIIYQFINMAYVYAWIKFKKEKIKNKYHKGLYKKKCLLILEKYVIILLKIKQKLHNTLLNNISDTS